MDMCMTVAKKLSAALRAHGEAVRYLVFGALTTLLNMALYALFQAWFGYQAANSWGNVLDNALCILFAYATNRRFVFGSRTRGRAAVQEFGRFVACRLGTMLLDAGVMVAGGNWLAPQGQALVLAVLGPRTASTGGGRRRGRGRPGPVGAGGQGLFQPAGHRAQLPVQQAADLPKKQRRSPAGREQ